MQYYEELEKQRLAKEREYLTKEKIQQITNKFYSSLDMNYLVEPSAQEIEKARVFLGEEKFQKFQKIINKINSNSMSQYIMAQYGDYDLTVEEQLFLIDVGQS